MPSPLYLNENVRFVAGKNFTFAGVDYTVGDDFDQELAPGRIETLVRTRHIYPVVDDHGDKPRFFHREVHDPKNLERILGKDRGAGQIVLEHTEPVEEDDARGPEPEDIAEDMHDHAVENALTELVLEEENSAVEEGDPEPEVIAEELYDPSEHTLAEVQEYLKSPITQEEYNRVIAAERTGKKRKGIIGE